MLSTAATAAGYRMDAHVEIGERDRGDAFDVDRCFIDLGAEREARQDGKLLRGVVALDVEGRIGLRVTQALRLAQAIDCTEDRASAFSKRRRALRDL